MDRDVTAELKTLTGTADNILSIYINRAVTAIKKYLNLSDDDDTTNIQSTYPDAVEEYVTECLNRKGNEGVKQFMQGSRQGTYVNGGISDDVAALLPAPYVKMMG